MAQQVETTSLKAAAAIEMRDTMRQLGDSMETVHLEDDMSKRDEEYQHFIHHAARYLASRDSLVNQGIDTAEEGILGRLASLSGSLHTLNDSTVRRLTDGRQKPGMAPVLAGIGVHHDQVLEQLDKLVSMEQGRAQQARVTLLNHYRKVRQLLYLLVGIVLALSMAVAWRHIQQLPLNRRSGNHQVSSDILTGLLNRREFEMRAARSICNVHSQSATHTLLHLDIDRFKAVTDSYGQHGGDELLRQLVQLLLTSVRKRDMLGRLGADEFALLLENCPVEKSIEIARALLTAILAFHFTWGNNTFTLDVSLGLVPIDHSTGDLASAMKAAHAACCSARKSGYDRIRIAYPGNRRQHKRFIQIQWKSRLTTALEEDRFTLLCQQIIPCASTRRQGRKIEILLRLIDDDGTIIAPGAFLPAAEKHALMMKIDRWVIRQSLTWLAQIPAADRTSVMACINLSAQSINDPSLHKYIAGLVLETAVSPRQVCFEIAETVVVANITAATGFMLTLRNHGFRFSLDDVGSGPSSFAYLRKLPVDYLKIDGGYIRDILSDPVDRAMVRSICELGQLLGKETIAEFMETQNLFEELKKLGIHYVQGHACAPLQTLDEFVRSMGPHLRVV
jgi:diguanylate cyclase (GGDEF)-like protein